RGGAEKRFTHIALDLHAILILHGIPDEQVLLAGCARAPCGETRRAGARNREGVVAGLRKHYSRAARAEACSAPEEMMLGDIRLVQRLGPTPTGVTEYSTATLSDAFQKLGIRNRVLDPGLRPLLPFTKMAGTAVTLKLAASTEPASYGRHMALAFEAGKKVAAPILVVEFPKDLLGATGIGPGGAPGLRGQYGFVRCGPAGDLPG